MFLVFCIPQMAQIRTEISWYVPSFLYPTDGTDWNGDKLVCSILYPSYGAIDTREQIPMKHGFIDRKPLRCSNVGMIDALFY